MRCSNYTRSFIFLFFALISKRSCFKYPMYRSSKSLGDSCLLEEVKTGCGADVITNIRSTCSKKSGGLYQHRLRWDAPLRGCRETTAYRIYIDQPTTSRICFQLAHNRTWFTFDASLGYAGDEFKFAVTAQPIVRVDQVFTQRMFYSTACPRMHTTSGLRPKNTTKDPNNNLMHFTSEGNRRTEFNFLMGASVTVLLVILLLLTARFVGQTFSQDKVTFMEVCEI